MLKPHLSSKPNAHSGVALVVVLLIVALVSILATQMVSRLQLNVVRAQNIKDNNQAYWYALGAEQFARKSLRALATLSPGNINLSQPWAQTFEYPVDGGSIKAELIDMQSCFNLNAINSVPPSAGAGSAPAAPGNSLVTPDNTPNAPTPVANPSPVSPRNGINRLASQQAFHNLLDIVIEDSFTVDTLTDSLIDWIDEDDNPSNFGAEDLDYESLPNPYLAANSPMSSASELRLINGISEVIQNRWLDDLLHLVCVLPESTLKLNVNTVTEKQAAVLAALLGDDIDNAQTIISNRSPEGFSDINDFKNLPGVTQLGLTAEQLDWFAIDTKYFKLISTTTYNDARFRLSTLFRVEDTTVTVVRREFGGY
ncbi:type II secretion system minor pseudopilin GspK [Glaciecola siphonariae]|uniref:Type II secretion system protein K n=1 Tax=Glaciecola siphonariae TaxID=521012 RepID=A0ABV9LSH8_9ALTE